MSSRDNPCKAQHRIAAALSPLLETYVDPWSVQVYPARGAWTHNRMDVQRWTGLVEADGRKYTIGSWGLTLSAIRKGCKMVAIDTRAGLYPDNNFQFEPE
jgi:hypothetical protein